jgi:hypothetical protein
MSVVINGNFANEVANTTIAAAQLEGLCLQYNGSGVLAPATTRIDAVLLSEVVTATEYTNRMYIFQEVDFGAFTQIGEPVSVAKGVRGLSALGLLVVTGSAIAAGVELELGTAGTAGMLKAYSAGTKVGLAIDPISATAVRCGQIHIY